MGRLGREHDGIDLCDRRLERQPINRRAARSHALERLIVRKDQRVFAGHDELNALGISSLQYRIERGEPLKIIDGLLSTPDAIQSFETSVGLGLDGDWPALPFVI